MNQFGEADVIVNAVFLALATLFLALRFTSRIHIAHRVTMSDYAMLIGWVLVCALSVANIYATMKGLGLREGVLESWRNPLARAEYVFAVLYVCQADLPGARSLYPTLTYIVSSPGSHQGIDPPILPDAGERRVSLPTWNLHHSWSSPPIDNRFDVGQHLPLSSSLGFLSNYNTSWDLLYRYRGPLYFHRSHQYRH